MKRNLFYIIGALLSVCILSTGCEPNGDDLPLRARERNIIMEEYDENYNHYEDGLEVHKKASKICVTGNATSGTIDLKLIENDKDGNAVQTFEYQITDILNETIELEKGHSENWCVVVDFNEGSAGHYKVEVYRD